MENRKPVIITTEQRGVFFGYIKDDTDVTSKIITDVKDCLMAIYWGTTKGVMELAATGPTDKSRISARCDIPVLQDVTAIFTVSPEAEAVWKKY